MDDFPSKRFGIILEIREKFRGQIRRSIGIDLKNGTLVDSLLEARQVVEGLTPGEWFNAKYEERLFFVKTTWQVHHRWRLMFDEVTWKILELKLDFLDSFFVVKSFGEGRYFILLLILLIYFWQVVKGHDFSLHFKRHSNQPGGLEESTPCLSEWAPRLKVCVVKVQNEGVCTIPKDHWTLQWKGLNLFLWGSGAQNSQFWGVRILRDLQKSLEASFWSLFLYQNKNS